jgi:hypothetical protein
VPDEQGYGKTVTDLVDWVRQQLDVDERAAQMVDDLHLDLAAPPSGEGRAMVFMSPEQYVNATGLLSGARVRAEVAAKRRLLDRHADCGAGRGYCDGAGYGGKLDDGTPACPDILDLAATLDYRPGYRAEWRP